MDLSKLFFCCSIQRFRIVKTFFKQHVFLISHKQHTHDFLRLAKQVEIINFFTLVFHRNNTS